MPRHLSDFNTTERASINHQIGQIGSDYIEDLVRLADRLDCDRDELVREAVKSLCKTVGRISLETYNVDDSDE